MGEPGFSGRVAVTCRDRPGAFKVGPELPELALRKRDKQVPVRNKQGYMYLCNATGSHFGIRFTVDCDFLVITWHDLTG